MAKKKTKSKADDFFIVEIAPTKPIRVCFDKDGKFHHVAFQYAETHREFEKLAKESWDNKQRHISVMQAEKDGLIGESQGKPIWKKKKEKKS